MAKPVYKRVLLKISGEALAGDKHTGLDFEVIGQVCDVIKECLDMGVQVGLVVGGGNFWRGAKNSGGAMERTRADHMGMLATVMNCLAVADVCEQKGIPVRVQTAIEMRAVAEPYIRSRAIRHLEKGRVVIFGAGTGNPYFSTDTAAVLRAAEIDADVILLAKNVDGVYTADPVKDPTAVKYDSISYDDRVEEAVKNVGAEYLLLLDQGRWYNPSDPYSNFFFTYDDNSLWAGIDYVRDSTPGFEVVLARDDMRLYRITAIDE